jgi:polysaccharide export outer membrane protein
MRCKSHFTVGLRSIVLTVLSLGLVAWAQGAPDGHAPLSTPIVAGVPLTISSGDLLTITVSDNPELTQEVRVEEDGEVNIALIGSAKLVGLTAQQAGRWIAEELQRRHFLLSPQVTVLIKEYASQGVSVTGEVNRPGVYSLMAARTVLDVISLAGGLTSIADTRVIIKHRSGSKERVMVLLKADDAQAALNENAVVYPGDLVIAQRAGTVYVLGDVGRPGGIVMQNNGRITLIQALALAGGAKHTAALGHVYLLHKEEGGYTSDRISVAEMIRGRIADLELKPNDILFVPGSRIHYLAQGSTGFAEGLGGAAVYHVLP